MKIKILSEEKLETLSTKENLDVIEKYIKDNPTNEWLKDVFKVDDPFTLSKVDMEEAIEKSYNHAIEKFGKNGYATKKFYVEDKRYQKFLNSLQYLIDNKD